VRAASLHRLRRAALSFDQRLRSGLDDSDIQQLRELLARLLSNVTGDEPCADQRLAHSIAAS
jgi:hypothetical protein